MLKYRIQKNDNYVKYSTFPEIPAANFRIVDSQGPALQQSIVN